MLRVLRAAALTLTLTLTLALPAACSDEPTRAPALRHRYVLRAVGDSTVPFVLGGDAPARRVQLPDTLAFADAGTVAVTHVVRFDSAGVASRMEVTHDTWHWQRSGATVTIVYDCEGIPCAQAPTGRLLPDGQLTLALPGSDASHVARYAPLDAPLDAPLGGP